MYSDIPEETKQELYRRAAVLAFPSMVEGFGLPLAEAMIQGLPIVALANESNKEVCGAGALLVGASAAEFADGLEEVLVNPAIIEELPARQVQQLGCLAAKTNLRGLWEWLFGCRIS